MSASSSSVNTATNKVMSTRNRAHGVVISFHALLKSATGPLQWGERGQQNSGSGNVSGM
jgi:hypothetical protein